MSKFEQHTIWYKKEEVFKFEHLLDKRGLNQLFNFEQHTARDKE